MNYTNPPSPTGLGLATTLSGFIRDEICDFSAFSTPTVLHPEWGNLSNQGILSTASISGQPAADPTR